MKRRSVRLIPFALAGATIFMGLTIYAANRGIDHPGIALVRVLPYGDKVGHLVLWGGFTAILNLALIGRTVAIAGRRVPLGTIIVAAVVIVEESSQGWLANRTLDHLDLVANFLGIGLATAAILYLGRRGTLPVRQDG